MSLLFLYCFSHRVHRVVTAALWRTFHHEGKISPGWCVWGGARPPPFHYIYSTITSKVAVYAPVERADTLTLFHLYGFSRIYFWAYCIVCTLQQQNKNNIQYSFFNSRPAGGYSCYHVPLIYNSAFVGRNRAFDKKFID